MVSAHPELAEFSDIDIRKIVALWNKFKSVNRVAETFRVKPSLIKKVLKTHDPRIKL